MKGYGVRQKRNGIHMNLHHHLHHLHHHHHLLRQYQYERPAGLGVRGGGKERRCTNVLRGASVRVRAQAEPDRNRGPPGGVYDDSTFYMMEKEERADGSHLYRFVGGQKSGRMAKSKRRVHFVGIGGAGLSSLASLALKKGWLVTGSDIKDSSKLDKLRKKGALVDIGHEERNVLERAEIDCLPDALVVSSAVSADNVEVRSALKYNIPVYKRGAWLGRITKGYDTVSVAGTHGKTSTSAMLALVLEKQYDSVTAIVGGDVSQFEGNEGGSLIGTSNWFVLEADEYDHAFLDLQSKYAIVTNVELDHLDIYESEEELFSAFDEFMDRVHAEGALVMCGDDEGCRSLIERAETRLADSTSRASIYTYGFGEENDWRASDIEEDGELTSFEVQWKGMPVGRVQISLFGKHNVLNALAVISLASVIQFKEVRSLNTEMEKREMTFTEKLKESLQHSKSILREFQGVDRRCQIIGERSGCVVISDYAHHPTEVSATLEAIESRYSDSEILVVFEPHTLSRLAYFFSEFLSALSSSHRVYISEIFEPVKRYMNKKVKNAIAEDLAAALPLSANASFIDDDQTLVDTVVDEVKKEPGNKVVLVLGAGKADFFARSICKLL